MKKMADNAPQMAYRTLYKKEPPFISGRSSNHHQKNYRGIQIDSEIPVKALDKLFLIQDIEPRSSCQGSDEIHPTFFIFRPTNQNEQYMKSIILKLNNYDDIYSNYDIGRNGMYRICITTPLWYDKDPIAFRRWWMELPEKIRNSL